MSLYNMYISFNKLSQSQSPPSLSGLRNFCLYKQDIKVILSVSSPKLGTLPKRDFALTGQVTKYRARERCVCRIRIGPQTGHAPHETWSLALCLTLPSRSVNSNQKFCKQVLLLLINCVLSLKPNHITCTN